MQIKLINSSCLRVCLELVIVLSALFLVIFLDRYNEPIVGEAGRD